MYRNQLSDELCQGDVIANFTYALINNPTFRTSLGSGEVDFSSQLRIKSGAIVILSHDCDVEVYNNKPKRIGLLFAHLHPLQRYITKDQEFDLEKFNRLDTESSKYIHLFFYEATPQMTERLMIDFSTMQSLKFSPTVLAECKRKKILELNDEAKQQLQEKLMAHFGRVEEPSEIDSGADTSRKSQDRQTEVKKRRSFIDYLRKKLSRS